MKKILCTLLTAALLCGSALCETISFDGSVAARDTAEVYADIGGTVERVYVCAGEQVQAGDALASLKTQKVYATQDGTVSGIFAQPGDAAQTAVDRFGAVLYIEGDAKYTISASTENAYNTTDTKFVHTGETVYLTSTSDSDHTGTGTITAIEGIDYTVKVTEGSFIVGETVNIYREESKKSASRIGRGTLTRNDPEAVTGSGSIVSFAVQDGDTVSRGDLLFETLDGDFDGLYMSGSTLLVPENGTVARLNIAAGEPVQDGAVAAVLYPENTFCVEGHVSEYDLGSVHVGDSCTVELLWNQGDGISYEGTVRRISALPDETQTDGDVTYTVVVDFTGDAETRVGMSASITMTEA